MKTYIIEQQRWRYTIFIGFFENIRPCKSISLDWGEHDT